MTHVAGFHIPIQLSLLLLLLLSFICLGLV